MKQNSKYITLFVHKNSKKGCNDCLETIALFESPDIKKQFKKNRIVFNVIEDKDGTYQKRVFVNKTFPLIREEGTPPNHYSGPFEIEQFKEKYNFN